MADVDDGSIDDPTHLYRRIRPDQIVDDQNLGRRRPSSAAFKDPFLSVDAESLLAAQGLDWQFCLQGFEGYSITKFTAGFCRGQGMAVVPKPILDNPAHTEVHGKKTQGAANAFVANSDWVHLEP